MNKKLTRLTYGDLRRIVKESVCREISETTKHSNLNINEYSDITINAYSNNELSDFLKNLPYNDDWYEDIYGALTGNDNQIRLNLIDNGYCITVCSIIGWQFSETPFGNSMEFYLLDDGGSSYHFFVKYKWKFYDAYNYEGVSRLSALQFCKIYMSKYNENNLLEYLKFVSRGEFDVVRANKLIRN